MKIDAFTARLIVGVLIPFVTAALVKAKAPSNVRGGVAIVLAAVGSLIVQQTGTDGIVLLGGAVIKEWALTLATAVLSYLGLWQHTQVNDTVLPGFGVGKTPIE